MNELSQATRDTARTGTIFGIATLIFGILCVVAPGISGLSVTFLVAVLLIAAGIARLFFAFQSGSFGKGLLTFLLGGLSILFGIVIMARPLLGLASLTMVLAAFFVADGIVEIIAAFKVKPVKGWGWMLFDGILSLLLGGLIIYEWPFSGRWAIGVLVGVRLIFAGWSMIALGSMGEAYVDEVEKGVT